MENPLIDRRIEECKELLRKSTTKEDFDDELHDAFFRGKVCTIREMELARYAVVFKESTSDGKYIVKNTSDFALEESRGSEFVPNVVHNVSNTDKSVLFLYNRNAWETLQDENIQNILES